MGWFTGSSSSHSHSRRPGYARSWAGSSYSSHRGHSSSSYYKRRPRDGYIQYLIYRLKKFLHEIYYYARRHPYKVFFAVIMPLLSSGVLYKFARQFGIRLPDMLKGNQGARSFSGGGSYYGSQGYGRERDEFMGGRGGMGGIGSLANGIGGLASVAKMAQAFM